MYDPAVLTDKQQINIFEAVDPNYADAPVRNGQALVQEPEVDEMVDDLDVKPNVAELQAQMAAAAAAEEPAPEVAAPRPIVATRNAKLVWLYKCRFSHQPGAEQKWWRFNGRLELDIEKAFQEGKSHFRVFTSNEFYTLDFAANVQRHDTDPLRKRDIARVLAENFKDYTVVGCEGIETPDVWTVQ